MKTAIRTITFLSLVIFSTYSQADIVGYDFGTALGAATETLSPTSIDPLVSATAVTNGGLSTFSTQLADYGQPVLQVSPPDNSTTTGALAVANDSYFSFTVTPNSGFLLDLTSLDFDAARGGGNPNRGWELRSSLDSFTATLGTDTMIPTQRPNFTSYSANLGASTFDAISGPVEFRIYTFSESTGNSVEYDNIKLTGTVVQVPEPSSLVFTMVAAIGFLSRRRVG